MARRVLSKRVCPPTLSICKFSQNWPICFLYHLFFLKLCMVLGPIFNYMWQSKIFLKKKMMSKRNKKQGFLDFLKNIKSLTLSGIGVKQNFLWSFNILWKLHAWEKSVLKLWSKLALANEISVFFNHQYFINRLISDFLFWNVDKVYQQVFWTIFVWGNWPNLCPKMAYPHNPGSIVKFFLKFATKKWVNR